jgi:hypothetical protein
MNASALTYAGCCGFLRFSGAIHGTELAVEIVRCVDDHHQPGWVEAKIVEVEGIIREAHDAPSQRVRKH